MKQRKRILFFITCTSLQLLMCTTLFSQNNTVDSLSSRLKKTLQDTDRVNTLLRLGNYFQNTNPDTAIYFHAQAKQFAEKINEPLLKGEAIRQMGWDDYLKGDYKNSLSLYNEALSIAGANSKNSIKAKYLESRTCGNIGVVYNTQADYSQALEYYLKALQMAEELGNKPLQANILGNIGIVYLDQANYPKSLDYYLRAEKMYEELNSKFDMSMNLANIGIVHYYQADLTAAPDDYFKALKMAEELDNKQLQADILGNIGNVYLNQANYPKALDYYFKAFTMEEYLGDKRSQAINLVNVGNLYMLTGKFKNAEEYLLHSIALGDSIGLLDVREQGEQYISRLYDTTGRIALAFLHYKKYVAIRDSINSDENQKNQVRSEMNYEFEKKQSADSIKNSELVKQENLKHEQEIQQQKIYTYGGAIGFLLMIVVAGVSFRAYRTKQKANEIIFKQKQLVEEKQKEILDSIHYAKRIQQSLLPSEKYIIKELKKLKREN